MYHFKFFETRQEALAFQRSNGFGSYGYLNHRSRSYRENYIVNAVMAGLDDEQQRRTPYCIGWKSED